MSALNDEGASKELLKSEGGEPPRIDMRSRRSFDSSLDVVAAVKQLSGHMNELLNEENRKLLTRMLGGIEQASRQTAAARGAPATRAAQEFPSLMGDARGARARPEQALAQAGRTLHGPSTGWPRASRK